MGEQTAMDVGIGQRTILVVEDSRTQAERLRLLLERAGYRVDVATNGREGVQRVQASPPDLIISDVVMPEMDGYALCRAVKSAKATKRIPLVLLTERRTPGDILRGLESGADNFITKPFEDPALLERVRRIFENLDLRRKTTMEVEVSLRVGGRELSISVDKAQIIELLFATLEDLDDLNSQLLESQRLILEHARDLEAKVQELRAVTVELEDARNQAQQASEFKSEFLSNMSHELRTPLNSVMGFADFLLQQTVGPLNEKQARYLTNIRNSGQHLLELINDILDLSKVEAGKLILYPEALAVGPTLEDILVIARGLAHKRGQTVAVQIEPELPPLQADPVRFKQILFNLLSNAIKFTPEGGRITLAAHRAPEDGERLEVRVMDTGVGIRAEDLTRLFQQFAQLETTRAQRHEGTGLGLALTKRLVELHGGRIWAESEGEGRGTTFAVILPFGGPAPVPEPPAGGQDRATARREPVMMASSRREPPHGGPAR